jgi:hypothetical protein
VSKPKKLVVEAPSEREVQLEQTQDFEIIIERYASPRSLTGADSGYGVRNKLTGVVELRFNAYSEALQALGILQSQLDLHMRNFLEQQHRMN